MGSNIIREEIRVLLDTINEQYAVIESYEGAVPKIEIDIVQANIRRMYECMNDLEKVNSAVRIPELPKKTIIQEVLREKTPADTPPAAVVPPAQNEPEVKAVIEKLEVTDTNPVVKEMPVEEQVIIEPTVEQPVIKVAEEITPESGVDKIVEESASPVIKTQEVNPPKQETKTSRKDKKAGIDLFAEVQKTTLADTFKTEQKPLHEKLSQDKNVKPLVEKIKMGSVKDLKSSIGINERFMFINELFKGNMQQYNAAIEKLNSFTIAKDAFAHLEEMKTAGGWENKAETYSQLEEFVMRKFLEG